MSILQVDFYYRETDYVLLRLKKTYKLESSF